MSIIINGTEIGSSAKFGNTDLSEIIFNDTSVWKNLITLEQPSNNTSITLGCAPIVYKNTIYFVYPYGSINLYKYNSAGKIELVSSSQYNHSESKSSYSYCLCCTDTSMYFLCQGYQGYYTDLYKYNEKLNRFEKKGNFNLFYSMYRLYGASAINCGDKVFFLTSYVSGNYYCFLLKDDNLSGGGSLSDDFISDSGEGVYLKSDGYVYKPVEGNLLKKILPKTYPLTSITNVKNIPSPNLLNYKCALFNNKIVMGQDLSTDLYTKKYLFMILIQQIYQALLNIYHLISILVVIDG